MKMIHFESPEDDSLWNSFLRDDIFQNIFKAHLSEEEFHISGKDREGQYAAAQFLNKLFERTINTVNNKWLDLVVASSSVVSNMELVSHSEVSTELS